MDACQIGAISLKAQRAEIDIELCNKCEVCIDACPNGAIAATIGKPPNVYISLPNNDKVPTNMILSRSGQLDKFNSPDEPKPLAKTVVSFLGSEIAPRLVDMAILVLENNLTRSKPTIRPTLAKPMQTCTDNVRMRMRRVRLHGRSAMRNDFNKR